jgi:hypothetical protein
MGTTGIKPMTDFLSRDTVFKDGIQQLEAAFRQDKLSRASIDVYYEHLKFVDDETFKTAVNKIIKTENFFPSISCFLSATRKKTTPEWV